MQRPDDQFDGELEHETLFGTFGKNTLPTTVSTARSPPANSQDDMAARMTCRPVLTYRSYQPVDDFPDLGTCLHLLDNARVIRQPEGRKPP